MKIIIFIILLCIVFYFWKSGKLTTRATTHERGTKHIAVPTGVGKITNNKEACALLVSFMDQHKRFKDRSYRSEALRDFRSEMKEHVEELKEVIASNAGEIKNEQEYLEFLMEELQDVDETEEVDPLQRKKAKELQSKIAGLQIESEKCKEKLKGFNNNRMDFTVQYAEYIIFDSANPNFARREYL